MTFRVIIQPQAGADIRAAYVYLLTQSPDAAKRWYFGIKAQIESLAQMPLRCPTAPEAETLNFPLRQLLHGKHPNYYRIVFRVLEDAEEVHILAVRHGARKTLTAQDLEGGQDD